MVNLYQGYHDIWVKTGSCPSSKPTVDVRQRTVLLEYPTILFQHMCCFTVCLFYVSMDPCGLI